MTAKIERFTCQKCGKRWYALDVPNRLPCTCDQAAFMKAYLDVLEANGERAAVFYYGPPIDRLQQWATLIDSEGKLYKLHVEAFASAAVYDKLHAQIAALQAAARDVVGLFAASDESKTMQVLRDLVHPPLGAKTPR